MMDDAESRVGSKVGNYRLTQLLGRGAMGTVYKAEHVYIGKLVAVKMLHNQFASSDEIVKRFLREAWAATAIAHPNIVDVTDFGETDDGGVFLVMEYLDGKSLDLVLARDGRFDLLRAITIMNQITSALSAAHNLGIFHRDLKPENIILSKRDGRRAVVRQTAQGAVTEHEGTFDFVKILDFGVAKIVRREGEGTGGAWEDIATTGGTVFGTPQYMAPESARGAVPDARADIYSVGIIFYEMLCGEVPFQGQNPMETLLKQISDPVPPLRGKAKEITPQAEAVVMKALAKDPAERHQSMAELHADLQTCYGAVRYKREPNALPLAPKPGPALPPPGDLDLDIDMETGGVPTPVAPAATSPVQLTRMKPKR